MFGKFLGAVFMVMTLAAPQALAAEVFTVFGDNSKAAGVHESFQPRDHTKLCYTGDYNTICAAVRSSVAEFNQNLASEGAQTRIAIKACAQTVRLAMLIYSFRAVEDGSVINKTIYLKECR